MYPGLAVGESEASYSPTLNYIFFADEILPANTFYVPPNATNYKTNSGLAIVGLTLGAPNALTNATISAVDASTGQLVWSYFIPTQGYRGGLSNSGNILFVTLLSGYLLMINAQTGKLIRDYFIGRPLNVLPSIGATASGNMEVIFPITAGILTWATGVPGDIVALSLQNLPAGSTNTVTATATTTVGGQTVTSTVGGQTVTTTVRGGGQTTTVTSTLGGQTSTVTAAGTGVDPTTLYGVAAVAVIFIIATGFLAMRGRPKPAP